MSIKVLIVDDQALVRAGFRMILETQTDIEVVGEAPDGNEAIRLVQLHSPDVVLMDIRMPGLDGIAATRVITATDAPRTARVVILTTYDLDEYVFDALAAGASGFLLKDVPPEELVYGVRTVARGDALLAPTVTRRLVSEFARQRQTASKQVIATDTLTAREREVLRLIARGRSNPEIAQDLYLSENTVKSHITHLLEKLNLRDRVQAVIFAYEHGVIEIGSEDQTGPAG
jgi:DNA-binding NarL/FixJ family response regulator